LLQGRRIVVTGDGPGEAADDPAEKRAGLVRVEGMADGAALPEERLPALRIGRLRGNKPGELLGPFRVGRAEKGVGQRDCLDIGGIAILGQRRIDKEIDRHVDLLMRSEPFLAEAEALDLVEIQPRLGGRHVEGRMADERLVCQVFDRKED
jgi:hypothetical protein